MKESYCGLIFIVLFQYVPGSRFQRPCGLRCRSKTPNFWNGSFESRRRYGWSFPFCVVQEATSVASWSLVRRVPNVCLFVCVCVCVCVCDTETTTMRRSSPELSCCAAKKKVPGGNEENSETPLSGQTVFQIQTTCVIDCAGLLCWRSSEPQQYG